MDSHQKDKESQLKGQVTSLEQENQRLKAELSHLRIKEEKFHAAFEFNPVTVSIIDIKEKVILDVNEGFLSLGGYTREQVIGKKAEDLGLWVNDAERDRFYQAVEEKGEVRDHLCQFHTAQGTKFALLSAKIVSLDGEPHLLFVAKDVQELVESNTTLKLQKRRIRALLDAPSDQTLLFDHNGIILASNQAIADFHNFTVAEFVGQSFWELVPEEQRITLQHLLDRAIAKNKPQKDFQQFDDRWVMINLYPITDDEGRATEFAVVIRDITDLKQAELAAKAREMKYRMLFESIDEGFAIFEGKERGEEGLKIQCVEFNQALHKVLQLPDRDEKYESHEITSLFDQPWLEALERVYRTGKSLRFETYLPEQKRALEVYAFIPPVGQLACRFLDITDRKKSIAELKESKSAAEAATNAKSRFLATMSHEIRTPLNGVLGMTSLLEQTELDEEQAEFVSIIGQCGRNLLEVINDILDFTKLESKKMQFEHLPFELSEVIEETLNLCAPQSATKRLELLYNIDPQIPQVLVGDPIRVRQVLLNLVGNAIKFSDQGEILVAVRCDPKHPKDCWFQFSVKDQGIGISPDQQKRLFEPFEQVDGSTTRRYGGTGLGLAISQRMVQQSGGELQVESKLGRGSTFTFNLKLRPGVQEIAFKKASAPKAVLQKQVLLFDDNPIHKTNLLSRLQSVGLQVTGHRISRQSLHLVTSAPLQSIIIVNIPDRSKTKLYADTVALCTEAEQRGFPIVKLSFLTDNKAELPAPNSLTANKPIRISALLQVMSKAINLSQAVKRARVKQFDATLGKRLPLDILVAEDNDLNQTLILKLLEKLGYQADLAENGVDALKKAQETPYDLLLLDIQMPRMDGVEVTKQIQQEPLISKKPVIIAMTANAKQGDRELYMRSGMQDYLAKPIDPFRLQQLLEQYGKSRLPIDS